MRLAEGTAFGVLYHEAQGITLGCSDQQDATSMIERTLLEVIYILLVATLQQGVWATVGRVGSCTVQEEVRFNPRLPVFSHMWRI